MTEQHRIPTFIINLERDIGRRDRILRQVENFLDFETIFISAVHGLTLPDLVCLLLSDSHSWVSFKGALGCFLSHAAAWERASKLDVPYVLILEDDTDILNLNELHSKILPADSDIIFVNNRMSPRVKPQSGDVVSMGEALSEVNLKVDGFGTDGYLLTPSAARKLVSACAEDLYYGHIDGRLVRYASTESDLDRAGTDSAVSNVIRTHHNSKRLPKLGLIKGYVLSEPLVRHAGLVSSRDAFDNAATD